MSQKGKNLEISKANTKARPALGLQDFNSSESTLTETQSVQKQKLIRRASLSKPLEEIQEKYESSEAFKSEVERFIEISKYFASPLRKNASYLCENRLVSYPSIFRVEYKRGGVTTQHIKFSNITLEPVFVKFFKLVPEIEQIKFINLSLSRCKRVPPGLSFNCGFVYYDVNEKPACDCKMIFVASRKSTTPCYQVCEIELNIEAQKIRMVY